MKTNFVFLGSESFSLVTLKINLVPDIFENEESLQRFKNRTKLGPLINVCVESVRYIPVK